MIRKTAITMCLGLFICLNIEATMVSFFIIETGVPAEGTRRQHSMQWENTLLDVFFDEGYIVSNAVTLRLDSKPSGEIQKIFEADITEAGNTGANYFIIAQLDYSTGSQMPLEITLVLFSTNPNKKIFENQMSGRTYRTTREEVDALKIIARGLIPHINAQ
ncbi:MAG: hypothetical protein FWC03_00450 [Treponema sp.]|nr:hypothetical protein [Treponema sp.]